MLYVYYQVDFDADIFSLLYVPRRFFSEKYIYYLKQCSALFKLLSKGENWRPFQVILNILFYDNILGEGGGSERFARQFNPPPKPKSWIRPCPSVYTLLIITI